MKFDVNSIPSFGAFDFSFAYDLWVEEAPRNSTLIEVGNYHGRSLIYLALLAKESNKNLRVVGVDWGKGMGNGNDPTDVALKENTQKFGVVEDLQLITATSEEGAKLFEDESAWLIFLDDDHSEIGFEKSFKAWYPKVVKGGILAGHDYLWHTVFNRIAMLYPQREHGPTQNVWHIKKK